MLVRVFKIFICCLFFNSLVFAKDSKFLIATASSGGTYYPVGVGIATIASLKLGAAHNLTFSAITSGGSNENIDMLTKKEVDFAIVGSMLLDIRKQKSDNKINQLRSISMLWQNVEQFIVDTKLAKTGNIMDLKNLYGKKFGIGARNSGSRISSMNIMQALGIDYDKMNLQFTSYSSSAKALQNRISSGMSTPAGVPASAVIEAFSSLGEGLKMLEFSDADIKKINKKYKLSPYVIAANTYPSQTKPIHTAAQSNLLVVSADTPDKAVYLLTKTIYENLAFLYSIHQATKAMQLEKALDGLPIRLHPGAIKYYKERGIKIPASLMNN